jgi:uncharacterized membrane-anchored protein
MLNVPLIPGTFWLMKLLGMVIKEAAGAILSVIA